MQMKFIVVAGKYDGHERNTKYVECFDTLVEAFDMVSQRKLADYPWCEIEIQGVREGFVYVIDCTAPQGIVPAIAAFRYVPQRS